jgi:hypothetical protein
VVEVGEVPDGLRPDRVDLLTLEGDRRALRVMLVVGRDVP